MWFQRSAHRWNIWIMSQDLKLGPLVNNCWSLQSSSRLMIANSFQLKIQSGAWAWWRAPIHHFSWTMTQNQDRPDSRKRISNWLKYSFYRTKLDLWIKWSIPLNHLFFKNAANKWVRSQTWVFYVKHGDKRYSTALLCRKGMNLLTNRTFKHTQETSILWSKD